MKLGSRLLCELVRDTQQSNKEELALGYQTVLGVTSQILP